MSWAVEVRSGEPDGDVEGDDREDGDAKAGEHGAAGRLETVDLGEDVADDVGEWEEEERAVGKQRPQRHALLRGDVGDEEHRAEDGEQDRVRGAGNWGIWGCHE